MGEIKVPHLGESIVEATVARWVKQAGEPVQVGDALLELETEKVNVEVAAEEAGTLEKVLHDAGAIVKVGEAVGVIANGAVPAAPTAAASAARVPTPQQPAQAAPEEPNVSAVARRLAEGHAINPASVQGSGPGGRVIKEDVMKRIQPPPTMPAAPATGAPAHPDTQPAPTTTQPAAPTPTSSSSTRPEERVPLTRRRQTIARRLVEAQHTAAMLTTFNEVDMTAIVELRKRRRDAFKERHGVSLGFMSFFTKASIGALKAFPSVNAELEGDTLIVKRYYDVGVAVSTDDGLVVPVLRDADTLTFAEIEKKIADLATRARSRALKLEELQGGTFTITNGGVFGSLLSTPILNLPQVAILGMHKIEDRPIAVGAEVVIRPMMYLALTYDHRVIDGKEAVTFLVHLKTLLDDPESLLLES